MKGIDFHHQKQTNYGLIIIIGALLGAALGSIIFWPKRVQPAVGDTPIVATMDMVAIATNPASLTPVSNTRPALPIAPDFELPDLIDPQRNHRLTDFAGQPVIINLWASWCAPCLAEMPALEAAYQEHRQDGLIILGINQTKLDTVDAALEMLATLDITFPNLRDDAGLTEQIFRVRGLPLSLFITAEGKIAYRQIGQMSEAQIQVYVGRLMNGRPINP